jgi:16S rRNA (uracil1498-N3)-methyltransferase
MGDRDSRRGDWAMKSPPWLLVEPGALDSGKLMELDLSEARHLAGSLRRRVGDAVVLADGRGSVARATLVEIERNRVRAEVSSVHHEPAPQARGVTLAVALIEGKAMDWAVQKAVEVGVHRLVPLESERAQRRARDLGRRVEHWRRISLQALKQCHRPWAMEITDVVTVADLIDSAAGSGVVADADGRTIEELPDDAGTLLAIGPEGGFALSEIGLFDRHGWPTLRLGPHVLRAETAVVVGGASMVARWERLSLKCER